MKRTRTGVTLVEILIALAVLAIGFLGLIASIMYASNLNAVNRETTFALRAAEQVVETMEANTPFNLIYARYNAVPGDDPAAPNDDPYGTAPLATFDVLNDGRILFGPVAATDPPRRLEPTPGDADGRVGRIEFSETAQGSGELTEEFTSYSDALRLGTTDASGIQLPLDLNGNNNIDANPVTPLIATTYRLLPILVTLEFRGVDGTNRSVQFRKLLIAR